MSAAPPSAPNFATNSASRLAPSPVRIRFDGVGVDFPTAAGAMRVVDGVSLATLQSAS